MDHTESSEPLWPRCDSCRQSMLKYVFRILFRDDVYFDVCEQCAPVPGDDSYTVTVWNIVSEAERYEETRS